MTALKYIIKFLGIALIVYVFAMVCMVPLGPGLNSISKIENHDTHTELEITGFATNFNKSPNSIRAFLVSSDSVITQECFDVNVIDNNNIKLKVTLPDTANSNSWIVRVNSIDNGWLVMNPEFIKLPRHKGVPTNTGIATEDLDPRSIHAKTENFHFPFLPRIIESIRNLPLHVPMWFTMFVLMAIAFVASIKVLNLNKIGTRQDLIAKSATKVGLLFGFLGLITGSLWARGAWLSWWVWEDPQLNGALVTVFVYLGYVILRKSSDNESSTPRIAAVYTIFAFIILFILLMIMPRFTESLHPGKSGNPAFSKYDLTNSLRTVFYPSVIGWIIIGLWMYRITLRYEIIKEKVQRKLEH